MPSWTPDGHRFIYLLPPTVGENLWQSSQVICRGIGFDTRCLQHLEKRYFRAGDHRLDVWRRWAASSAGDLHDRRWPGPISSWDSRRGIWSARLQHARATPRKARGSDKRCSTIRLSVQSGGIRTGLGSGRRPKPASRTVPSLEASGSSIPRRDCAGGQPPRPTSFWSSCARRDHVRQGRTIFDFSRSSSGSSITA